MSAIYEALQPAPMAYQDTFQSPRGPVELISTPSATMLPPTEAVYAAPASYPTSAYAAPVSYTTPAYAGLDSYPAFVEALPALTQSPFSQALPIASTLSPIMASSASMATGSSLKLPAPAVQYAAPLPCSPPSVSSTMLSAQGFPSPPLLGQPQVTYLSPPSYASPSASPRGLEATMLPSYAVGESVEVWSKSRQAWCPGRVKSTQGTVVDVDFQFPDGGYAGKHLSLHGGEIRSPASSPRALSPTRMLTPSPVPGPRRQPSFPMPAAANQVVRTISSGSVAPTQVVRSGSAPTLPLSLPLAPVVTTIEMQYEQQLRDRDQQIGMKDRLVEDLRQAIDSQRREAEELRRQQTELVYRNQEQARRLADLETLLHDMQSPVMHHERRRPPPERLDSGEGYVRERSRTKTAGSIASQALALRAPEPTHLLGGDRIDLSLQEFFDMHPDFEISVNKLKPGWYTFDKPINKKVYIKMVGDSVLVQTGGGCTELHKWLSGFRSRREERR